MSTPLLPLRVLAIDDQAIILRTLKVVLGGLGITNVDESLTIDDAEEKLRGAPYDIIICDLNLPGRDGIEFLRGKRAQLADTGVILLSGEDERILHSVTAMGRSAGLNLLAALSKPATAAKLLDALSNIETVIPSRRASRSAPMPSVKQISEMLSGGGLSMHFQPKVRLSDKSFVGLEALLRGRHADLGDVGPRAIVESAEAQDRAGEISRFVIENSIAAAGRFYADGLRVVTSINVEGSTLRPQLPDMLADLAEAGKLPMASLAIEIAEPAVLVDYVNALEVTTRLRLKRCVVSLDQFGSGTASLRQLQDMPFSELKIDRSFIKDCDKRSAARLMITSSIGVARSLGMQTVAVGVETVEEWNTVQSLGVDLAQGSRIADAMPEGQIADWAAEWSL